MRNIKQLNLLSALVINGHENKHLLKDNSPFVRFFEVGAEKEGFWKHNYMALQTEYIVDCLQVLYPNTDILFLLDQSSGHARKRLDSLNIVGLNGRWGGKQKKMRDTKIMEGCLGPHNKLLTIGDIQSMVVWSRTMGRSTWQSTNDRITSAI